MASFGGMDTLAIPTSFFCFEQLGSNIDIYE